MVQPTSPSQQLEQWYALFWTGEECDLLSVAARLRKDLRCRVEVHIATQYLFCSLASVTVAQVLSRKQSLPKLRAVGPITGREVCKLVSGAPTAAAFEHGQAVELVAPPFERVLGRVVACIGEQVLLQVRTQALFRLLLLPGTAVVASEDLTIAPLDYKLLTSGRRLDLNHNARLPRKKIAAADGLTQQLVLWDR